jgi:DNA-binding NtrC family response regulator
MSPRLLVIEPDAAGRALMERALSMGGFAPETAASIHDARACLDAGTIEVAVVDELAGGRGLLDEVRWLRARYPSLPVIVTGTRLAPRTLEELLRLGAADALRKPFTPTELREAAARAVARAGALHPEALEYAAALEAAREEIAAGRPAAASPALGRAQAASPLDA